MSVCHKTFHQIEQSQKGLHIVETCSKALLVEGDWGREARKGARGSGSPIKAGGGRIKWKTLIGFEFICVIEWNKIIKQKKQAIKR